MDSFLSLITVIYHRKTSTLLLHAVSVDEVQSQSGDSDWGDIEASLWIVIEWQIHHPVQHSLFRATIGYRWKVFSAFFPRESHFEWSVRLHKRAPPSYADAASAKRKRTIAAMKWLRWDACVRSDAACKRESRNREQSEKSLSCSSAAAEWVNRKSFKIKRFSEWFAAYRFFVCFSHSLFLVSPYIIYLYCAKDSELAASAGRQTVFFFIHEKPVIQWNNMLLMNEQERKKNIYINFAICRCSEKFLSCAERSSGRRRWCDDKSHKKREIWIRFNPMIVQTRDAVHSDTLTCGWIHFHVITSSIAFHLHRQRAR